MSRFKNPEKHIKMLRNKIARLENNLDMAREDNGRFLHRNAYEFSLDTWGTVHDGLVPGDTIIAICNVDKVMLYTEDDKRAGEIDITITELRKR